MDADVILISLPSYTICLVGLPGDSISFRLTEDRFGVDPCGRRVGLILANLLFRRIRNPAWKIKTNSCHALHVIENLNRICGDLQSIDDFRME